MLAGDEDNLVGLIQVTTILPVRELNTSQPKQLAYAKGKRCMDVQSMILLSENLEETNVDTADAWVKQLVSEFNKNFPHLNLVYGGNAVTNDLTHGSSLDE
mmetsp:Transcript_11938/g.14025  ORF Transcript_11938/g.14025 Transcript_11938/m.14025 type:complete len:101 (-) Transcript_11938:21-323(-)